MVFANLIKYNIQSLEVWMFQSLVDVSLVDVSLVGWF